MNPPGSNEPPQAPGPGVPPGYTPPPGGFTPPGGSTPPPAGGFTPPGAGGFPPPGGGFTPPGSGGFTPPAAGGFSPPPGGGFGTTAGQLAEWPQRALGGLIDFVGPFLVAIVILAVARNFLVYVLFWLLSAGWGAYNGYLNGSTGQSIGKKVVGLKVVGEQTGQVIGGGQGVLRWAIAAVPGIIPCAGPLYNLVDLLFPLWDPKKQTLHDKAVKTLVIVVPK
ncbi:MAG: RDD family protein [Acidimicrobiales bacterium]